MNICIVTKEICVLVAERDFAPISQWHVTEQVSGGQEFKATKLSRASALLRMPRLKIYKRHVKTHHIYLKPFPQIATSILDLSVLLPEDLVGTPPPPPSLFF